MKKRIIYDTCVRAVGAALLYYGVEHSKGLLAVVGVVLLAGVVTFIFQKDEQ